MNKLEEITQERLYLEKHLPALIALNKTIPSYEKEKDILVLQKRLNELILEEKLESLLWERTSIRKELFSHIKEVWNESDREVIESLQLKMKNSIKEEKRLRKQIIRLKGE